MIRRATRSTLFPYTTLFRSMLTLQPQKSISSSPHCKGRPRTFVMGREPRSGEQELARWSGASCQCAAAGNRLRIGMPKPEFSKGCRYIDERPVDFSPRTAFIPWAFAARVMGDSAQKLRISRGREALVLVHSWCTLACKWDDSAADTDGPQGPDT